MIFQMMFQMIFNDHTRDCIPDGVQMMAMLILMGLTMIRSDQTINRQITQLISMEGFLILFLDGQDLPQIFLGYLDHLSLILFICKN